MQLEGAHARMEAVTAREVKREVAAVTTGERPRSSRPRPRMSEETGFFENIANDSADGGRTAERKLSGKCRRAGGQLGPEPGTADACLRRPTSPVLPPSKTR